MKNVSIKYNPYLLTTEISVDGKQPKKNSSLNVGNKRLQEWVEQLPGILLKEYGDQYVKVEFTGTQADFEDVEMAFDAVKNKMKAECHLNKKADNADVEVKITKIFNDIQAGPVKELKDKKILQAFEKAKNAQFEVNVVATMSSGKSTLINALLGQKLMPAANEATTATIVKIVDTEQDNFSAVAFGQDGQKLHSFDKVTLKDMKALNSDPKVTMVELRGNIPFVKTTGMRLVLVDTPGPNNSRDKKHEEMTYQMIANSEKSLVLYVMNGTQLGINDEKIFLDYVCDQMKDGGKKSRERFLFVVNKMDNFKPREDEDGPGCIRRALDNVVEGLKGRGIYDPNVFPVAALPTLEQRTDDDEPEALAKFLTKSKKYSEMQFENYYDYSHLPQSVHKRIDSILANCSESDRMEIYSGIVSIEQAISMYVNKYARATKVRDLVDSFNSTLDELAAVAKLEEDIRKDKSKKAELDKQIVQIKAKIKSAQQAQKLNLDDIDMTEAREKIRAYIHKVEGIINRILAKHKGSSMIEKSTAIKQTDEIRRQCEALPSQIRVEVGKILDTAYKNLVGQTIEKYKQYLKELNLGVNNSTFSFNPINLVSSKLADLGSIIDNATETIDESYYVTKEKQVWVEDTRYLLLPWTWFNEGDHWETQKYQEKVSKFTDYVDMQTVSEDYLLPIQQNLIEVNRSAESHLEKEMKRLAAALKSGISEIDKVLDRKLDELSKAETEGQLKASEIAEKEANLKWMNGIQKRVNNIIKF